MMSEMARKLQERRSKTVVGSLNYLVMVNRGLLRNNFNINALINLEL
jgi:hypothetical protein